MAQTVQVAILSDSRLFREALWYRLALENEIEVVGKASTVYALLVCAGGRPVDVLLVYLNVRSALAAEIVWDIKTLLPATRVVVLGREGANPDAVSWIEAGAVAWLEHEASYESLLDAIRAASEGRPVFSPEVVSGVICRLARLQQRNHDAKVSQQEPLTDRQDEVARLLRFGLVNKEIARHLGVKRATVKNHVSEVLRKLRLERRRDLDLRRTRGRDGEEN